MHRPAVKSEALIEFLIFPDQSQLLLKQHPDNMDVTFKLETFEGPLDLLLHLIQKNKVAITDIPIALITEQYLAYLDEMKKFDMEITGEFLVMASQLLYIKSKMLLPKDEDEKDDTDPRAELVDRLVEYAKYRNAVEFLDPRQNMSRYVFYKTPDKIDLPKIRYVEMEIPLSRLLEAYSDVMERRERKQPVRREAFETIVKRETVSVSSRIKYLFSLYKTRELICFDEFFEDVTCRAEAVSTFLAVLELIRRDYMKITEDDRGRLICSLSGDPKEFDTVDSEYGE